MVILGNVLNEFKTCTQLQYNGTLNLKSAKNHKWSFYYRLGRIIWASGGIHPFRRWRRQMAQNCPEIDVDKIRLSSQDVAIEYWDYRLLEILYKNKKFKESNFIIL